MLGNEVDFLKGPDPILGRYKLAESEGFDEFMKALGVGIIKRKMANAAVPVVVVEIQEDGESGQSLNFLESHSHPIAKYQLQHCVLLSTFFGLGLKTRCT